jgi:hypothetical protein
MGKSRAQAGSRLSFGVRLKAMAVRSINPPDNADIDRIAKSLIHANQVVKECLGLELNGTVCDLSLIQQVLASRSIEAEATYTLEALGFAVGDVFVTENPGYDWWMVEDEYGRDPAIRYLHSDLLAHPGSMILRRVEDGEAFDVLELYESLRRRLSEISREWVDGA